MRTRTILCFFISLWYSSSWHKTAVVWGFQPLPFELSNLRRAPGFRRPNELVPYSSPSDWQNSVSNLFQSIFENRKSDDQQDLTNLRAEENETCCQESVGVVARLAVKGYDEKDRSHQPSSKLYTTRKIEQTSAQVTNQGMQGDYNHYRSLALKSTPDRAISIWTMDVQQNLEHQYPTYNVQPGDLGENILIDGVPFDFFAVGAQYEIISSELEDGASQSPVVLEITEPMIACANICKLPYINDDGLPPKERIARCQDFLHYLDQYDGYRGWYAKVIHEGRISLPAKVVRRQYQS